MRGVKNDQFRGLQYNFDAVRPKTRRFIVVYQKALGT
jgi:hypothetical protein